MAAPRKQEREYTVPQASAMLGLTQQEINNALERDLKPLRVSKIGRGIRTVSAKGLMALELLRAFAKLFQPGLRARLIKEALRSPTKERVSAENVVVYIAEYMKNVRWRKSRLQEAEALVTSSPEVLGGEPCIKETRTPAYLIGTLARRHGVAKAHKAYPFVSLERIELLALYVAAYPRRGRPPETALAPPKTPKKRGKTKKIKVACN
jgi:uncharacterized protein (DUF433 family)